MTQPASDPGVSPSAAVAPKAAPPKQAVAASAPGVARVFGWLEGALWWAMPAYLLIMQKRAYGQGRGVTVLKYGAPGSRYLLLVGFAVFFACFAGVAGLARL